MNIDLLKKLVIIFIFINFILISFHRLNSRNNSEKLDQGAYLKLGLMINERKALTDTNRNPLYPMILSLFAERESEYFITGKLLTLSIGFFALLFIFFSIKKNWDITTASAVLIIIIPAFIEMSSGIICEALITLWFFMTWICIVKGFENYKYWIFAGIFSGLSILTKGTGNLLLISFVITLISVHKTNLKKMLPSAGYFLSHFLIALPLIIYNLNKFGEPFYNINSKSVMWLEDWEEVFRIKTLLPTAGTYFKTHSLGDIFVREIKGIFTVSGVEILFLFLFVFGILPFLKLRYFDKYKDNYAPVVFPVSLVLIHLLLLAWITPIGSSTRYIFPLYPVIFTLLFDMILFYYRNTIGPAVKKYLPVTAVILGIGILGEISFLNIGNPYKNEIFTFKEVERWLNETKDQSEKILYGPSDTIPRWRISDAKEFVYVPSDVNIDELEKYAIKNEIKYFIFDIDIFNRRKELFSTVAHYDEKQGLIIHAIPDTWKIFIEDTNKIKRFFVIEFQF